MSKMDDFEKYSAYEEYLDDEDDYKSEARHNRTHRRIFAKRKAESMEHIENAIERTHKRVYKQAEKESFFER